MRPTGASEGDRLLERRLVRAAHRAREDPGREADPLRGRVGAPRRRVGALRRLELRRRRRRAPPTATPRTSRRRRRRRTASRTALRPGGREASGGPSGRTTTSRCTRSSPSERAAGRSGTSFASSAPLLRVEHAARARRWRSRLHAASITAAPGASILPSRSASSRLPPAANHASSCAAAAIARGVPVPRARTSRTTGQTRIEPQVLRRGAVHRADDARERVLLPPLDAGPEQVDPLHRRPTSTRRPRRRSRAPACCSS